MKRFFCLLMALLSAFVFALSGCQWSDNSASSSTSENSESSSTASTPEPEPITPTEPTEPNFTNTEAFTFLPSDASSLNVERFKADFIKSTYYREGTEYEAFYNYMPEEISREYNIDAFEVVIANGDSEFYLWHDGFVTRTESIGAKPYNDAGFIHFALTDINKDGYFELLCSYNLNRTSGDWSFFLSHFTVIDSRSKTAVGPSLVLDDGFAYFKIDNNGDIAAYISETKNVESANTLYTEFVENTALYEFSAKELFLKSKNYEVKVTIDEGSIHFPMQFKGAEIEFQVTAEMTYLGKTFTYVNNNTYCEGASPTFKNDDDYVPMESWAAGDAITTFTIKTGDVLTRNYYFYEEYGNPNQEGTYHLSIGYRGEKVSVENFLTISQK